MAAPPEDRAIEAMKAVQALGAKDFDARIDAELGEPMLGIFSALARSLFPGDPDEETAKKVHLMVLGYLLRCEVEKKR